MFYYDKGNLALETVFIFAQNIYFPKRKHILVVETLYLLRNIVIMRFRPHNRCRYVMYVISSRETRACFFFFERHEHGRFMQISICSK